MSDLNVIDKSMRSVFVGNIPYEATEEKLKDIFCEVGPVVSFKLVYDRETGKPKGYGFCEYKDQETALSAMRNLNGYEIAGRTLRVDNACTEKSRMEMANLMAEPVTESPYGPPVDPTQAPETISKAVASLPPEQMFQLMQQMKLCIQNNPQEARTMLLQNPQLAYALLQAQVVMRIVNPETAVTMLHKTPPSVPTLGVPPRGPVPVPGGGLPNIGLPGPAPSLSSASGPPNFNPVFSGPVGDLMGLRPPFPGPPPGGPSIDSKDRVRDPRNRDPRDRSGPMRSAAGPLRPPPPGPPGRGSSPALPPHLAGADPEKAKLIMQVLQLTDEQIAMLPAEQRESIMVLKEQINQPPPR